MNKKLRKALVAPKTMTREQILASFKEFMKGKKAEDLFPESNKRAYENLTRAGLI